MIKTRPLKFKEYLDEPTFIDRFKAGQDAVDVIIPLIHTNEMWRNNLLSIYREIPVNRLIISDGGCIDGSIEIAKQFPRVKILNHKKYVSLGYCIKKLIEEVETEWFTYLHSDVYLPTGWFDTMKKNQSKYDWFECRQHLTVLVDYPIDYTNYDRPLSGSQMGRKAAFNEVLPEIDDDYLYRNEDLIFANLVKKHGGRYGRVDKTFHYHQMMNKRSKWRRNIKNVSFNVEKSVEEEKREYVMQVRGIVKYTKPEAYLIESVQASLTELSRIKEFDFTQFKQWVEKTNPIWLPYMNPSSNLKRLKNLFVLRII
jgi:glycosyltransferase involved in cell wall biosynthesis